MTTLLKNLFFTFLLISITIHAVGAVQPEDEEPSPPDTLGLEWLDFDLVDRVTLRYYYMDSEYPSFRYPLVNSYGDAIKLGVTPFFNIEGRAQAFDYVSLYYNFQADLADRIDLRQASLRFRYDPVAVELARGTVWFGHGYYGSLLLSNNADSFNLVKIETTEPIRIPYIGNVGYMIFQGWPDNFNMVGHRLSFYPLPWLELSASKIVVYTDGKKLWYAPFLLARNSSIQRPDRFRDSRASLDIAVRLPGEFLSYVYPLVEAKVYFEYGGEDIQSFWTTGGKWVGPLGFEFIGSGNLTGIHLATEQDDLRLEYAQNYRSRYLLSGFAYRQGWGRYSIPWYGTYGPERYINGEDIMGHHMGSHADVIYFHYQRSFENGSFRIMYGNRRRGLIDRRLPHSFSEYPEVKNQYGIEVSRSIWNFDLSTLFLWNRYVNVDVRRDPLIVQPVPDREAAEYILGLRVSYRVGG